MAQRVPLTMVVMQTKDANGSGVPRVCQRQVVVHPRGAAARHGDGRLAVAVDRGGRVQWLVQQLLLQLAQEHQLVCHRGQSHVLGVSRGRGNRGLQLAVPRHWSA